MTKKLSKSINRIIKKLINILKKPEMAILPGELAFSIILSLVPTITVIGYCASFFNISMDTVVDAIKYNFSESVVETIIPIISGDSIDANLTIILIFMFYFASNGPASIILASNQIFGIKQSSFIKRRLKAIALTFLILILYLFILLVPVFGSRIIDAIDYFHLKSILESILTILSGPISWVIIFVFIKMIFTFAPDTSVPSSRINIGAILTTIGWIITTYIYSYYVTNIAKYDLFYAGLSNIMVLMLWIYFLSYIMVVGLSLTSSLDSEELENTISIPKV